MKELKDLPRGVWLHLSRFPAGTTEQDVVDIMVSRGLAIGPEQISCKAHADFSSVIISIDAETVRDLVQWALQDLCPVPGRELRISTTGAARNHRV